MSKAYLKCLEAFSNNITAAQLFDSDDICCHLCHTRLKFPDYVEYEDVFYCYKCDEKLLTEDGE